VTAITSPCRDRLRSCRVFVVDNQIGNDGGDIVASHRRSATSTPLLPRVRLTSLIARLERRFGIRRQHRLLRQARYPALGHRRDGGWTIFQHFPTRAFRRSPGVRRLLEARASHLIATICGGETSCVEARDWAAFEAKDPMVRVSQDPQLLMRHITPFSRVAALRAAGHRRRGSQPL
jgi:hypothetical protein